MPIPRGYEVADEFSQSSGIVTLLAGDGFLASAPRIVTTRNAPTGAWIYLVEMAARVIDAGSDQVFFSLRRNGMFPFGAFFLIPGVQFDFTGKLGLDVSFTPALMEIVGHNISGTGLPGAGAGASIRVQAYWTGFQLRPIRKTIFA